MYLSVRQTSSTRPNISPKKMPNGSFDRGILTLSQRTLSNPGDLNQQLHQQHQLMIQNVGVRSVHSQEQKESSNGVIQEELESEKVQVKLKQAKSVEEVFDILVKEHIDFRDIRYQDYSQNFDNSMDEFNENSHKFENTNDPSLSAAQNYMNLQSKFYQSRARDQKDLRERFENMMKIVRNSHTVEIQNITSKFSGIVKDSVARALQEQKKHFEIENRQLIDNSFQMKATIRKLEEKALQLQQKVDERDFRLQESYEKLSKLSHVREKDQQIETLTKQVKKLEETLDQKKANEKGLMEREKNVNEKERQIIMKNAEIVKKDALIIAKDGNIATLSKEKKMLEAEIQIVMIKFQEMKQEYQNAIDHKAEKVEPVQPVPVPAEQPKKVKQEMPKPAPIKPKTYKIIMPGNSNNSQEFRKMLKNKREENNTFEGKLKELLSYIKLKENQIKLLQVEVMGLREESETYLSNIQSMRRVSTQGRRREAVQPTLNDLILGPMRIVDSTTNGNGVGTEYSEDGRYLSSVFSKTSGIRSIPSTAPGRSRNHSVSEDKENLVRGSMFNGDFTARNSMHSSRQQSQMTTMSTKTHSASNFQSSRWNSVDFGNNHSLETDLAAEQADTIDLYRVLNSSGTQQSFGRSDSQTEKIESQSDMYKVNFTTPLLRIPNGQRRSKNEVLQPGQEQVKRQSVQQL